MSLIDAIKLVLGDLTDRKVRSQDEGNTIRIDSAYGPGDFRFLEDGTLEQSFASFYGVDEKIETVRRYKLENGEAFLIEEFDI